jgi:hypothetical protein
MLVLAKCVRDSWNSTNCFYYRAGATYEIDHEGVEAALKPNGRFAFEFDRTMAGTGVYPAIGGFRCKTCPLVFDTVNELGTHSRTCAVKEHEEPEEEKVQVERRGRHTGRTFTCKQIGCDYVAPNLYAMKVHKKTHAETVTVPA